MPDHVVADASALEPDWLARQRIRGLLLDLDGTLVGDREDACSADTRAWIALVRGAGVRLCVVSNSGRARVVSATRGFEPALPSVWHAGKPLMGGLLAGLRRLGLPTGEVALVGDQIFTDVLAGNALGVRTVLIRRSPADARQGAWRDGWLTRLKRPLERMVLQPEAIARRGLVVTAPSPSSRRK